MWKKVDSTVLSWILTSLSKELNATFVHTETSKQLWDIICQRYGENNGPMKYKIKRELRTLTQGTSTVVEYFNKFTKLLDELACVIPDIHCDCDKGQIVAKEYMEDRVYMFVIGLNESYDTLKNQFMLLEPLPSLDKAFSMILVAERQRSLNVVFGEHLESPALPVKSNVPYKINIGKQSFSPNIPGGWAGNKGKPFARLTKEERAKLICDHCGGTGHEIGTCFKIHGVPDWYQEMKERKSRSFANFTGCDSASSQKGFADNRLAERSTDFNAILQQLQQMTQFMKEKDKGVEHPPDFAQFVSFAGTTLDFALSFFTKTSSDKWIIDTGASRPMCTNKDLMRNLNKLRSVITVCLPDGSKKQVEFSGDAVISSDITLTDVLYIPSFKYNLLSITQLCSSIAAKCIFLSHCCYI